MTGLAYKEDLRAPASCPLLFAQPLQVEAPPTTVCDKSKELVTPESHTQNTAGHNCTAGSTHGSFSQTIGVSLQAPHGCHKVGPVPTHPTRMTSRGGCHQHCCLLRVSKQFEILHPHSCCPSLACCCRASAAVLPLLRYCCTTCCCCCAATMALLQCFCIAAAAVALQQLHCRSASHCCGGNTAASLLHPYKSAAGFYFAAFPMSSRACTNAATSAPSCSLSLVPTARRYSRSASFSTNTDFTLGGIDIRNIHLHRESAT